MSGHVIAIAHAGSTYNIVSTDNWYDWQAYGIHQSGSGILLNLLGAVYGLGGWYFFDASNIYKMDFSRQVPALTIPGPPNTRMQTLLYNFAANIFLVVAIKPDFSIVLYTGLADFSSFQPVTISPSGVLLKYVSSAYYDDIHKLFVITGYFLDPNGKDFYCIMYGDPLASNFQVDTTTKNIGGCVGATGNLAVVCPDMIKGENCGIVSLWQKIGAAWQKIADFPTASSESRAVGQNVATGTMIVTIMSDIYRVSSDGVITKLKLASQLYSAASYDAFKACWVFAKGSGTPEQTLYRISKDDGKTWGPQFTLPGYDLSAANSIFYAPPSSFSCVPACDNKSICVNGSCQALPKPPVKWTIWLQVGLAVATALYFVIKLLTNIKHATRAGSK